MARLHSAGGASSGDQERGTAARLGGGPLPDHGRVVRECIASRSGADLRGVELIVCDDGSRPDLAQPRRLDERRGIHVLRPGETRAERRAQPRIEAPAGRYSSRSTPTTCSSHTPSSGSSPPPGRRGAHRLRLPDLPFLRGWRGLLEPPAFNPWLLTRENYVDTCALIDREVFDVGLSYPEDVFRPRGLGLLPRPRGAGGIRASRRGKVAAPRKQGFTRSDLE